MTSNTKVMGIIIALLGIVVVISLACVCFYAVKMYNSPENIPESNTTENSSSTNETSCVDLGCTSTAKYVGSKNSDKYYLCSCRYAKNINPENIICFDSDEEAVSKNYTKVDC